MSDEHWSDRGQNVPTFNDEASGKSTREAELEKNWELLRQAMKRASSVLELNPPWAGEADAAADRVRRAAEVQNIGDERNHQRQEAIQENMDKVRSHEQIEKEKKRQKQEIANQQEVDQQARRDALKTEAEYKRQQAQSILKGQERSNPQDSELESYREQFRQAVEHSKDIDLDIE